MSFYYVPTDWRTVLSSGHLSFCVLARTVVGIVGSVFVLWIIDCICRKARCLNKAAIFGTTTLGVYVMHEWPMLQIKDFSLLSSELSGYWKWPLALAIFLSCHFLVEWMRKHLYMQVVLFGNEKWLSVIVNRFAKR